jgi:hypothetical protein
LHLRDGNPDWAVLEPHLATYRTWVQEVGGRYDYLGPFYQSELRPLATTLSRLPMEFSIPGGLIGAAALLVSRQTRGIALAGAPHLLFLTLVVAGEGKNATSFGGRALIGSADPLLWYSSGARHFYFITDLLYPSDISKVDLKNYFSIFDAVVVGTESYLTWNQQRIAPVSLLLKGTLGLRAFFLGNFAYLALSAHSSGPIQAGFIYNEQTRALTKFQADNSGDTVFFLAKVGRGNVCKTLTHDPYIGDRLYGCNQLLLPAGASEGSRRHHAGGPRAPHERRRPSEITARHRARNDPVGARSTY